MDFVARKHPKIPSLPGVGSMVQQLMDLYNSKRSTMPQSRNNHSESSIQENHQTKPFPFLSLPRELRDQIYAHLFEPIDLVSAWTSGTNICHDQHLLAPSLLSTSRQLRAESLATFFRIATIQIHPLAPNMRVKHALPSSLQSLVRKANFTEHKFCGDEWAASADRVLESMALMPSLCKVSVRWHHWGSGMGLTEEFQQIWAEHPLRLAPQFVQMEMTQGDLLGFDLRFCRTGRQVRYRVEIGYAGGRRVEWEEKKTVRWGDEGPETAAQDENAVEKERALRTEGVVKRRDTLFVRLA